MDERINDIKKTEGLLDYSRKVVPEINAYQNAGKNHNL
jgi:hypothetical protein